MRTKGLACLTVGIALLAWVVPASAGPLTDSQKRVELQRAVSTWIENLANGSKNEHGKPTKRGYFSRDFSTIADGAYQVTAHVETAGKDTKTTERFLLTLSPEGSGFKVTAQVLQDTYAGIHRETHSRCYPFAKFSFHREGIQLEATNGSVCTDIYQDAVNDFRLHSQDMTYRYEPPADARKLHLNREFHSLFPSLAKDHARELEFKPAAFLFTCDPGTCEELLSAHFTGLERAVPAEGGQAGSAAAASTGWDKALTAASDKEERDNPFAHFQPPYRPGHKRWSVFIARELDPFVYPGFEEGLFDFAGSLVGSGVRLTSDNWAGWEITFSVWPRRLDVAEQLWGTIYGYYSEETLAVTKPYDLERRDDHATRWDDAYSVKGTIELGVEDPETLAADIEFGIELKQPLRELPFAIESIPQRAFTGQNRPRMLHVNSVQLDGKELTWTRTSQLGGLLILPEEMPAGSKLKLRMNFATRALYKFTPSFTYVSRFGWMPFVRIFDFVDTFELTLRVPAQYKVLGVGRKVSEQREGDVLVTTWVADSPVEFASVAFGRYQEDGPGKGFDPARKLDGTPIPVTVHVDKDSFVDWGIRPDALRPIAQQAVNAINLYSKISGLDYPYGELNFVNDPLGVLYGQAPSSLIYLGSGVFRGEGFLASLPIPWDATSIARFLKSVTAHEVGHQWWGSRVANANDRNYWFVESLAEYFSGLFLEFVHGPRQYQEKVDEWRRTILETRLKSSVQNASSIWSGEDGFGSYQAAVYNKGPYAFHMLREIFKGEGPPGPEGSDK